MKTLLSIFLVSLVLLGACSSPSAAPIASPTPQETTLPPIITPSPSPTPTPSSTPSPTPTGPYTGPLFDTHLHLFVTYGSTSQYLLHFEQVASYFERGNVEGAIGFYPLMPDRSSMLWVSTDQMINRGSKMGIIPLLQPFHDTDLASGKYSEAILRQYLQPQWLCRGVGEIVLSKPELQSVTFDGSVMQTVFKVVNDMKGIVMVHPSSVFQGGGARTTDLAEIEPSIKKYPDTIFLFHPIYNFDLIAPLMSKYPNVYYSWDFAGSFYRGASYRTSLPLAQLSTWGSAMFPTDPNAANAESFLAMVNQVGVDHIVEENLKMLAPQLQKYPDRIMWGTDLAHPWHFEESVTDMVIRISHELIGRLPADVQEKYAYQNAQRVFGRFLPSNP